MVRRLLLVAALAAAVFVPASAWQGAAPPEISVDVTKFTLPNGLTVILHEDHRVPQIAVNLWYHVGSAWEKPGRTGFAHLFEHLMFEGSGHVKEGLFDDLLEAAGGTNNASTTEDRTNYFELVPSNALDLPLYLESDRMGYLLDIVTPTLVDSQRDVVKNERRQRYENTPYAMAYVRMSELLYPPGHPYHWPVIGYMDDLSAASQQDVVDFFRKYYSPANASLVIAGDINTAEARRRVEYWFQDVKPGAKPEPLQVPQATLTHVIKDTLTDQVQLPRIIIAWLTPPWFAPGDADLDITAGVLANGKNSRLYKRLVYDMQLAQDVSAAQESARFGSVFSIEITARPSTDPPATVLARITSVVDEEIEKLRRTAPDAREVDRVRNGFEAGFFNRLEQVADTADEMNAYYTATGDPNYFGKDLARYRRLQPADIKTAVERWLPADRRLELSVVPAK